MESIGDILREARHNKQVSLADAARVTKIKADILEKLEADDYSSLAAPMYTKGFLKLYADFLGLNGQEIADQYLRNQGGLRRQGMRVDTVADVRAKKPPEVQLPIGLVMGVVGVLTVVVLLSMSIRHFWTHRSHVRIAKPVATAPVTVTALPKADFDAYYQPRTKLAPELLEVK